MKRNTASIHKRQKVIRRKKPAVSCDESETESEDLSHPKVVIADCQVERKLKNLGEDPFDFSEDVDYTPPSRIQWDNAISTPKKSTHIGTKRKVTCSKYLKDAENDSGKIKMKSPKRSNEVNRIEGSRDETPRKLESNTTFRRSISTENVDSFSLCRKKDDNNRTRISKGKVKNDISKTKGAPVGKGSDGMRVTRSAASRNNGIVDAYSTSLGNGKSSVPCKMGVKFQRKASFSKEIVDIKKRKFEDLGKVENLRGNVTVDEGSKHGKPNNPALSGHSFSEETQSQGKYTMIGRKTRSASRGEKIAKDEKKIDEETQSPKVVKNNTVAKYEKGSNEETTSSKVVKNNTTQNNSSAQRMVLNDGDIEDGEVHINKEEELNDIKTMANDNDEHPEELELSIQNNKKELKLGPNAEKEKLREKIKNLLLSAGWKIDLRPRRERDYLDAVYISPSGKSLWSVVNAYHVYVDELNSNEKSAANLDLFLSISDEIGILKRKSRKTEGETSKIKGNKKFKSTKISIKNSKKRNKNARDCIISAPKKRKSSFQVTSVGKVTRGRPKKTGSSLKKGKNEARRGTLLVRNTNKEGSIENGFIPYAGKQTILSWLIDSGVVSENEKVQYMRKRHTQPVLDGKITREGILCSCCNKTFSGSMFEIHSGSKLCQPLQNILLGSGHSLLQCHLDAWDRQKCSERCGVISVDTQGNDPNDDTCSVCGDGGDLICCDRCPSTFHQSCLDIQEFPSGDWLCPSCSCKFCGLSSDVSSLFTCCQCQKKYHQKCIQELDASPRSPSGSNSFCNQACRKIFLRLQKLIGVKNDLVAGFSWTLLHRFDTSKMTPRNLARRAECNSKLAVALIIMDECFMPIIDQRSGSSLIPSVVYNCQSNFNRLDYNSFYTFVLERDDEIVSAASIRIHGIKLAEMPFIATRHVYRRQGMCRRLLNAIETVLRSLNVEKLVIPAIADLMHTWTTVFSFQPLEDSHKQELKSITMMMFPGAGLLQKPLLQPDLTEGEKVLNSDLEEMVVKSIVSDTSELANGGPDISVHPGIELECLDSIVEPNGSNRDAYNDVETAGSEGKSHTSEVEVKSRTFLELSCSGCVEDLCATKGEFVTVTPAIDVAVDCCKSALVEVLIPSDKPMEPKVDPCNVLRNLSREPLSCQNSHLSSDLEYQGRTKEQYQNQTSSDDLKSNISCVIPHVGNSSCVLGGSYVQKVHNASNTSNDIIECHNVEQMPLSGFCTQIFSSENHLNKSKMQNSLLPCSPVELKSNHNANVFGDICSQESKIDEFVVKSSNGKDIVSATGNEESRFNKLETVLHPLSETSICYNDDKEGELPKVISKSIIQGSGVLNRKYESECTDKSLIKRYDAQMSLISEITSNE